MWAHRRKSQGPDELPGTEFEGTYSLPAYESNCIAPENGADIGKDNKAYVGSNNSIAPNAIGHISIPLQNMGKEQTVDNTISIEIPPTNIQMKEKELLTEADFEDISDSEESAGCLSRGVSTIQDGMSKFYRYNGKYIKYTMVILAAILYTSYFIWSNICDFKKEDDIRLVWMTSIVVTCIAIYYFKLYFGHKFYKSVYQPIVEFIDTYWYILKWILVTIAAGLFLFFFIYEIAMKDANNMISLVGIVVIILMGYIGSFSPKHVIWRPVIMGLFIQFLFALFILRTSQGKDMFNFMGKRVTEFLAHTDDGSKFVFGDNFMDHFFAFKLLPVIIFFNSITAVLYYIGALQVLIMKVSWIMQVVMGTTTGESFAAAANIFLGMTETQLMIRPLLGTMTNSELHSVMTGGFATVAGSVLAVYISFGVPAEHILAASVMSAPAALAVAKLMYPETKKSKTKLEGTQHIDSGNYANVIDALSTGASDSVSLIANIVANLIAFLAILGFVNATLSWLGDRACSSEKLSFELICGYLLWPLAWVMGIRVDDCFNVGQLIGLKTFLNEYIAYSKLGEFIKNRKIYETFNTTLVTAIQTGRDIYIDDGTQNATLIGGYINVRSEVISTYILCGFSNFGSVGIVLGALTAMIPHRKFDLSRTVIRAMVAGNFACFLTACVAGLFYKSP